MSDRRTTAGIRCAWVVMGACSSEIHLQADVDPSFLLLVADESVTGQLSHPEIITSQNNAFHLQAGSTPRVAFAVDPSWLETTSGPMDPSEAVFELRKSATGCGECSMPGRQTPRVYLPGDRCPVFAEASAFRVIADDGVATEISGEVEERVARQLTLGYGRECSFPVATTVDLPVSAHIRIEPRIAGDWPVKVYATTPNGALGLFDQSLVRILRPDGTEYRSTDTPFVDIVRGAVGFEDGFLVLSRSAPHDIGPDRPGRSRFHWVSMEGDAQELSAPEELGQLLEARQISDLSTAAPPSLGPRMVGVIGRGLSNSYSFLFGCSVQPDRFGPCRDLAPDQVWEASITRAIATDDGDLWVAPGGPTQRVARGIRKGEDFEWTSKEIQPGLDENVLDVSVDGDTAYVVGRGSRSEFLVFAVPVSGPAEPRQLATRFGEDHHPRFGRDEHGRLFLMFIDGPPLAMTESGAHTATVASVSSDPRRVIRFQQPFRGHTLLEDECGALHLTDSRGTTQIHGTADPNLPCLTTLAVADDGVLHGFGRSRHAVLDGAEWRELPLEIPDSRVTAALPDGPGSFILGTPEATYRVSEGQVTQVSTSPPGPMARIGSHSVVGLDLKALDVSSDPVVSVTPPNCEVVELASIGPIGFAAGGDCLSRVVATSSGLRLEPIGFEGAVTAIQPIVPNQLIIEHSSDDAFELHSSPTGESFELRNLGTLASGAHIYWEDNGLWLRGHRDEREFDDPGHVNVLGTKDYLGLAGLHSGLTWDGQRLVLAYGGLFEVSAD